MTFEIEEGQRQMILLALAELALERPGWDFALGEVAEILGGSKMFNEFKRLNADRVAIERKPVANLTAQQDMPDTLTWLLNARQAGGGFVSTFAEAALSADWENYPLMRPAVLQLRKKYPKYDELQKAAL